MAVKEPQWNQQCQATAAYTGERCKRMSVAGAYVCSKHGGMLPSVRRKAAERMESLREQFVMLASPALHAVRDILEDPDARPADRLKAAELVIDRLVAKRIETEVIEESERDLDEEIRKALGKGKLRLIIGEGEAD